MAVSNNSINLSRLQQKNFADGSDQLVAWSAVSNADVITPVSTLYANGVLTAQTVVVTGNSTPATSTSNTTQHAIWSDGTYIYVAVSNNSIKRVLLSSF